MRLGVTTWEATVAVRNNSARGRAQTARQKWAEMPRWQQVATFVMSAAEIVLTTTAAVDLARRPRRQVRGPKALWAMGFSVQPFGPIAYLALGRRR
ncbi:MAG TPA: PLD nuclease N-terminal domain-containing protein [Actinoplanes sp.]|nr:PLD nuclease N-terminal domain-containing protein [Actinoplanes sp.]